MAEARGEREMVVGTVFGMGVGGGCDTGRPWEQDNCGR